MKQTNFTTIILEADNNKYLTQTSENININERIVASKVAIGSKDSADNWKEITEEEANEIKQAKEEAIKESMGEINSTQPE